MRRLFQELDIDFKTGVHIPALDGIRGLAIILILLVHHFHIYAGWIGVDLFFVLSGFLITGILVDTKQNKNYYKNYIARRVLRIFPLYYSVLIIFFIIIPLVVDKSKLTGFSIYYEDQSYYWTYLQNWIHMFRISEYEKANRILMHFWSLAIEEQFYIIWPLIIYLFSAKGIVRISFFFIIVSLGLRLYFLFFGYHWAFNYLNTFARIDSLSVGALIAIMVRNNLILKDIQKATPYLFKVLLVVLISYIIWFQPHNPGDLFFKTVGYTLTAIFFGTLLIYSLSNHKGNIIKPIMELNWLRFFGRYSYSMYVLHFPIIWVLRPLFYDYFEKHFVSQLFPFIFGNLLCLSMTIIISQITWRLIEQPALRLKKYFN